MMMSGPETLDRLQVENRADLVIAAQEKHAPGRHCRQDVLAKVTGDVIIAFVDPMVVRHDADPDYHQRSRRNSSLCRRRRQPW